MGSFKEIVEGWFNHIFDNPTIKEEAERRASVCAECPLNKNNVCSSKIAAKATKDFTYKGEDRKAGEYYTGCGCPLSAKTKSPSSECPLGRW